MQRESSLAKKIKTAVKDVIDDIPIFEDAVVEIFLGHRKRSGDATIKKYVIISMKLTAITYFLNFFKLVNRVKRYFF